MDLWSVRMGSFSPAHALAQPFSLRKTQTVLASLVKVLQIQLYTCLLKVDIQVDL